MLLLTSIGFFPSFASFIFIGGSDDLSQLIFTNIWIQVFIICIFGVLGLLWHSKKYVITKYFLLLFLLFLWILSGRTIILSPHGRLSSGWFYFETHRSSICDGEINCDRVFYYETELETLNLWHIRIKNNEVDLIIFVGPLIWGETINLFKTNFHNSKLK